MEQDLHPATPRAAERDSNWKGLARCRGESGDVTRGPRTLSNWDDIKTSVQPLNGLHLLQWMTGWKLARASDVML